MAEQRSQNVPLVQSVKRSKSNRDKSIDYRGSDWSGVSSTVNALKRGYQQDSWFDFSAHMLMVDGHLKTVHDTRINGVMRAELVFEPASESEIDKQAADFCRESYEATPHRKEFLHHMLYAESVGWTSAEAVYKRKRGMWHVEPVNVRPRDTRVDPDWYYEVRTHDDDGAESWIETKVRRDKWIVHAPTSGSDTVLTSGDLISCAPSWYFKKQLEIGWLQGLERYANGILVASHPSGSRSETITKLQNMMQNLSFDHACTVEDTVTIQHFAGQMDSAAYDQSITHFENVESKVLVGSPLNTDGGGDVGSYKLGVSQFATTTLPRLEVMGDRLAETMSRDWFAPLLKFNAPVFGGIPGTPKIHFKITGDATPTITRDGIDAKTVTNNELRAFQGLTEWSEAQGGNDIAIIEAAPAAPAFSEQAAGGATTRPLSRPSTTTVAGAPTQLNLPMTKNSSVIGGRLPMKVKGLQIDGLESQEPPPSKGR